MRITVNTDPAKVEVVRLRREAIAVQQASARVSTAQTKRELVTVGPQERVTVASGHGLVGPAGPPGIGLPEVFVQNATPNVPVGQPFWWVQIGLGAGGADWTLWYGVGPATP